MVGSGAGCLNCTVWVAPNECVGEVELCSTQCAEVPGALGEASGRLVVAGGLDLAVRNAAAMPLQMKRPTRSLVSTPSAWPRARPSAASRSPSTGLPLLTSRPARFPSAVTVSSSGSGLRTSRACYEFDPGCAVAPRRQEDSAF